jgi:hypothetical protein
LGPLGEMMRFRNTGQDCGVAVGAGVNVGASVAVESGRVGLWIAGLCVAVEDGSAVMVGRIVLVGSGVVLTMAVGVAGCGVDGDGSTVCVGCGCVQPVANSASASTMLAPLVWPSPRFPGTMSLRIRICV